MTYARTSIVSTLSLSESSLDARTVQPVGTSAALTTGREDTATMSRMVPLLTRTATRSHFARVAVDRRGLRIVRGDYLESAQATDHPRRP